MMISKLCIFLSVSIFLPLNLTQTAADAQHILKPGNSDSLRFKLDKLTSKIKSLESLIDKKNEELKGKDEIIAEKEKIITSLQREIALFKVHDAWLPPWLAARLSHAKSHWNEYGKPSFKYLTHKVISAAREQWLFVRANVDVQALSNKAKEVYIQSKDALTPHVINIKEVVYRYFQPYAEIHWSEHVKLAFEYLMRKGAENKAQAEKWIEPHVQATKTKLVSAARDQWLLVRTNVDFKSTSKKAKEVYIQSKDALISHMINIKYVADPLFRTLKEVSKTYIDHIATNFHLDKAWETVTAYTKQAVSAYWNSVFEKLNSIIRFKT